MRICLISSPTVAEFSQSQVAENEAIRILAEHAPMGILSLAAVLENLGIFAQIVDLNQLYYDYVSSRDYQLARRGFCKFAIDSLPLDEFDVIGFSTICSSYPLTIRMAREVAERNRRATIILGGPQASVVDVKTLSEFPFIDLIVRGEAEATLPQVLEVLKGGGSCAEVPGTTFREDARVMRNPNAPVIANLDDLPMPAFHLYPNVEKCSYLSLEIGRGCPFACSFCSTNDFFRRQFRLKSPDKMLEQMKTLKKRYHISTFDLIHDMFTINRKKVVAFCEAIISSGEKFYWSCSARTDCIDDELINLMADAGCKGIFFGIDSGSDRMQEIINKRLELDEAIKRIEHADKRKIDMTVSLITGFPEETKDDLASTVAFLADSLRFDQAEPQFHLLAPLAETPITTKYKSELVFDDIFSDMSFQGWEQEALDREMISSYPEIFTNFYAVPTRWLDRSYLKELRELILKGMRRFRWLFVMLHQDCGDLLRVFDDWRSWYPSNVQQGPSCDAAMRRYYLSDMFGEDFVRFVRSHYCEKRARNRVLVSEFLNYETERHTFRMTSNSSGPQSVSASPYKKMRIRADTKLAHEGDMRVVRTNVDVEDVISRLGKKQALDEVTTKPTTLVLRRAGDNIEVIQITASTDELLMLCDGIRTVAEVAMQFSSREPGENTSDHKTPLFGLKFLCEQRLVREVQQHAQVA